MYQLSSPNNHHADEGYELDCVEEMGANLALLPMFIMITLILFKQCTNIKRQEKLINNAVSCLLQNQ